MHGTEIDREEKEKGSVNLLAVTSYMYESSVGIFKQSMGARNRVGKVLSYRPAMQCRTAMGARI